MCIRTNLSEKVGFMLVLLYFCNLWHLKKCCLIIEKLNTPQKEFCGVGKHIPDQKYLVNATALPRIISSSTIMGSKLSFSG